MYVCFNQKFLRLECRYDYNLTFNYLLGEKSIDEFIRSSLLIIDVAVKHDVKM